MTHYVVVRRAGRAEIIETDNPNAVPGIVVDTYSSRCEAEQRRDIENDTYKLELLIAGKLKIRKCSN